MTPSNLKYHVSLSGSYFFNRTSMRFFGDTMANYGVRSSGDNWELYRKRPVMHGLRDSAYFNKVTFDRGNV